MKDFFQAVMAAIRQAVDLQFGGNISRASHSWGVTGDNLHKWLRGDRVPTLEKISPIMNRLGISLNLPHDAGREACFVNAKGVSAGEGATPPQTIDYLAAPWWTKLTRGMAICPKMKYEAVFRSTNIRTPCAAARTS